MDRLKRLKPGACDAVFGIRGPGLEAQLALSNLRHETFAVFPGLRDCDWASILVECLTLDQDLPRAALVQDMLNLAVRCGTVDTIAAQVAVIRATGLFDRRLSDVADIRLEPALSEFDPLNGTGILLWECIGKLITALFSTPRSMTADRNLAELKYAALQCSATDNMTVFLSMESKAYDGLRVSGAEYSGYTRIGLVLDKLSSTQREAYSAYKQRLQQDGRWTAENESLFAVFANDIERVALTLPPEPADAADVDSDTDRPANVFAYTHGPEAAAANRRPGHTACPDHCWQWQFVGTCTYGDKCRRQHVGLAGAFKDEVADAAGRCLLDKTPAGCRRKTCPFDHAGSDSKQDTAPAPTPAPAPAPAKIFMLHSGWNEDFTERKTPSVYPLAN
jgi:hypothetical protein